MAQARKSSFQMFGERTAATVIGWQDVWPGPTPRYPFPANPEELEVVSAAAENSAGGTGVQSVRLTLMDASWRIVRKSVTLNGLTPVAVPDGPYRRVLRMVAQTAGSYGWTEGDAIDARTTGGAVLQRMNVDTNSGRACIWTFSADQWPWGINAWRTQILAVKKEASVQFELQARNVTTGLAWLDLDMSPQLDQDSRGYVNAFPPLCDLQQQVWDMRVTFVSDTVSEGVYAGVRILRNDDSIPTIDDVFA